MLYSIGVDGEKSHLCQMLRADLEFKDRDTIVNYLRRFLALAHRLAFVLLFTEDK